MSEKVAKRAHASQPLTGTDGPDLIFGTRGADVIGGRGGDDVIFAKVGRDKVFGDNIGQPEGPFEVGPLPPRFGGTPGDNVIFAGPGDDSVTAGFGADLVSGGAGDDTVLGYGALADSTAEAPEVIAADGPDRLFGGRGKDLIYGGGGDDLLIGGKGKDVLIGGVGVDTLIGGADEDVFAFGFGREPVAFGQEPFVFRFSVDTGVGPGNRDLVQDFDRGEDKIDLSLAAPTGRGGVFPAEFLDTNPFGTSFALQVRYDIVGDRTIVQFATYTGNPLSPPTPSGPSGEIELFGIHHLTKEDFIF